MTYLDRTDFKTLAPTLTAKAIKGIIADLAE